MNKPPKPHDAFTIKRPDGSLVVRATSFNARNARDQAIEFFASTLNPKWADHTETERWRQLYKAGYRIVPVAITPRKKVRR